MSIITNSNDLVAFCNKLKKNKFIAVDTEFVRDRTYYPKLCLLQISNGINSAAIDTLENIDLTPVFNLFLMIELLKYFMQQGKI